MRCDERGERLLVERFFEEWIRHAAKVARDVVTKCIAAHEDDALALIRSNRANCFVQLHSREAGHHDVGENEIVTLTRFNPCECVARIDIEADVVIALEQKRNDLRQPRLIIDNEHARASICAHDSGIESLASLKS